MKTDLLIAGVVGAGVVAGLGLLAHRRWARRRRERAAQAGLARQLAEQEATAREQFAAEIQNGFGHRLVLLRNGVLTARAQPGSPKPVQEELDRISGLALSALDEARALAHRLRPVELERLGFARAIEELLTQHLADPGIRVFKEVDDLGSALSPAAALYLYRLVEAMVRDVGQQVGVTTVLLEVKLEPEQVRLRLEHDGPGRPAGADEELPGMAARVRLVGGEWRVSGIPGSGTRWQLRIPREPA